jgi:hypothetical protein
MAKPYSNCDIDNQSPGIFDSDLYRLIDESPYEYTKKFCLEQCIQTLLIQKCSCSDYKRASVFKNDTCLNNEQKTCVILIPYFEGFSTFIMNNCSCPLECNSTQYKYFQSSNKIIGDKYVNLIKEKKDLLSDYVTKPLNYETARDSVVSVNVYYESLAYTLLTESAKMNIISLLADIGGNMSLFLGISLFSFIEFFELLFGVGCVLL